MHRYFASMIILLAICPVAHASEQNRSVGYKPGASYSPGYIVGNTLYVSGQPGMDSHGNVIGLDMEQQTTTAINSLRVVVRKAGFRMSNIVSVTIYVTNLLDVEQMHEVFDKLIPDPKPARIVVQVAALMGNPKIEMTAIAVRR